MVKSSDHGYREARAEHRLRMPAKARALLASGCTYTKLEWHGAKLDSWTFFNRRVLGEAETSIATNGTSSLVIRGYESDQGPGAEATVRLLEAYLATLKKVP